MLVSINRTMLPGEEHSLLKLMTEAIEVVANFHPLAVNPRTADSSHLTALQPPIHPASSICLTQDKQHHDGYPLSSLPGQFGLVEHRHCPQPRQQPCHQRRLLAGL